MPRTTTPDRVLATVLFTDIVGSTELAASLGDRRWRDLVARHHTVVRAQLKRFHGRETMTHMRLAVAAALVLVASCSLPFEPGPRPSPTPSLPTGGTLRLAIPHDDPPPSALASSDPSIALNALDPHFAAWYDALELQRCCLSRTLLSYVGRSTEEGGTVLQPDLAESLPEVSRDGLTWTFRIMRIRQGSRPEAARPPAPGMPPDARPRGSRVP